MTVSFKLVRETFTSRVTLDRPNLKILVEYLQGPFSNLENRWTFEPKSEADCDVGFFLAYEFKSRMLAMLMGTMFDTAFQRFAAAFEKRADVVYGKPGASRASVKCAWLAKRLIAGARRRLPPVGATARDARGCKRLTASRRGFAGRLRSARQFHQHAQRFHHRTLAHRAAADRAETAFAMQNPAVARGDGEMHQAHRLARRRAAGTRDAGDRRRRDRRRPSPARRSPSRSRFPC